MSAPYIIPFNFQPVLSDTQTTTYTVPSGKYSYVYLGDLILPTLNGESLTSNVSILPAAGPFAFANAIQINNVQKAKNAHRVSITVATTAVNISFGETANNGMLGAGTNGQIYVNVGTSSITFASAFDIEGISTYGNGAAGTITAMTADVYNGPSGIWLKAGDVLAFTSGRVTFTEYNSIS